MCANAAPGIVVENNRFINTLATYHAGISIRGSVGKGDEADRDAVVRNNIACFPSGAPHQSLVSVSSPGATLSGNVTYTGAAGKTGVCAR